MYALFHATPRGYNPRPNTARLRTRIVRTVRTFVAINPEAVAFVWKIRTVRIKPDTMVALPIIHTNLSCNE